MENRCGPLAVCAALERVHPRRKEAIIAKRGEELQGHPRFQDFPLAQARFAKAKKLSRFPLPDPKWVAAGLQAARDQGAVIRYDSDESLLLVTGPPTPPITFTENDVTAELGRFTPGIAISRNCWWAFATALEPCESHDGEYHHPHVRSIGNYPEVCLGDIAEGVAGLVLHGAFDAALTLIADGLTQYNSESPYYCIEDWFAPAYRCCICERRFTLEEDGGGLNGGGDAYCSDCGVMVDGEWYNEEDTFWCECCEENRHYDDHREAPCCGNAICVGCLRAAL